MYVIYDPRDNSMVFVKDNGVGLWKEARYKTERAAKAGLTRIKKKEVQRALDGRPPIQENAENLVIVHIDDYRKLDRMVERTNYITGEKYMEDVNTPRSCSPSSELYWSM